MGFEMYIKWSLSLEELSLQAMAGLSLLWAQAFKMGRSGGDGVEMSPIRRGLRDDSWVSIMSRTRWSLELWLFASATSTLLSLTTQGGKRKFLGALRTPWAYKLLREMTDRLLSLHGAEGKDWETFLAVTRESAGELEVVVGGATRRLRRRSNREQ